MQCESTIHPKMRSEVAWQGHCVEMEVFYNLKEQPEFLARLPVSVGRKACRINQSISCGVRPRLRSTLWYVRQSEAPEITDDLLGSGG